MPLKLPGPPRGAFALIGLAAFAFLLTVFCRVWSPQFGITKLIMIGREFDRRGTAVFRATPKYMDPFPAHRWGFDGHFYAEMALDPLLRDPQLHVALDDPPYRGRRILLSWLAWAIGLGQPFWVLNAFAALNLLFWIGFAWLGARLFAPYGWSGLAGYAAVLVTCGIVESMHASLTDFPAFVLILGAIVAGGAAGAGLLAAAGLTRPESLIGFVGVAEIGPPWRENLKKNLVRMAIIGAPIALWIAYVLWRFWGRELSVAGGNLDWPFRGIMEKLGELSVALPHGVRWHRWLFELYKSYDLHALLTVIAVMTQIVYLALHREWANRLWRWAAVIAVYFVCISYLSWESHFTVTRHALPMTFVFNLLLAARPTRGWLGWFVLGNCFVPFGVHYLWSVPETHTPPRPAEFAVVAPAPAASALNLAYGSGWSSQQWDGTGTWRWARTQRAEIIIRNSSPAPVKGELDFLADSTAPRHLEVDCDTNVVLRRELPRRHDVLHLPLPLLPPGETHVVFTTPEPARSVGNELPGDATFSIENPVLKIEPTGMGDHE